jgi:hypothetical protein
MRGTLLAGLAMALLAGCSEGTSFDVHADLVESDEHPFLVRLEVTAHGTDVYGFDPEQHVRLETQGGELAPAYVEIDANSTQDHAEFLLGFNASPGQEATLVVRGLDKEHRFELP